MQVHEFALTEYEKGAKTNGMPAFAGMTVFFVALFSQKKIKNLSCHGPQESHASEGWHPI